MKRLKLFCVVLCAIVLLFAGIASAQEKPYAQDIARAVELYEKGDMIQAIGLLEKVVKQYPNDGEILYLVGSFWQSKERESMARNYFERLIVLQPERGDVWAVLAYYRWLAGEKQSAADAAQTAIRLDSSSAETHHVLAANALEGKDYEAALREADIAIKLDSKNSFAYISKHFALVNLNRKPDAANNLEQYLKLFPQDAVWKSELEYLRADIKNNPAQALIKPATAIPQSGATGIGGSADNSSKTISKNTDLNISPLKILSFPKAGYTERARNAGAAGSVVLRATFYANQTVGDIRVVKYLPFGLTERAIEAARSLKFQPKMVNGVPVSTTRTVEFGFQIY